MSGMARARRRSWLRGAVPGLFVVVGAAALAGCGVSAGAKPVDQPDGGGPAVAAAGLTLPCQPGSGKQISSAGPMNLTDLSGQPLDCAVFDHLVLNQVELRDGRLPGATFRSTTLNQVDFGHATLTGATFDGSTLNFPDFTNADLRGAKLTGAHLNSPVWTGATCPDGTPAADSGADCGGHLDPLPATAGTAALTSSAHRR
jgi:hypothetical protein